MTSLLSTARLHWQTGSWEKLAETKIDIPQIGSMTRDHEEALLYRMQGLFMSGRIDEGRKLAQALTQIGLSRHALSAALISGVQSTIARAHLLNGNINKAKCNIAAAIAQNPEHGETELVVSFRLENEQRLISIRQSLWTAGAPSGVLHAALNIPIEPKMRACYLCFSLNNHFVGKNLDFDTDIFVCDDCGLIQNDFVSSRYLDQYYHKKYRQIRREFIRESYLELMAQRAASQQDFINLHLPDDQSLNVVLDIGAGAGKLIETFHPASSLFAVESDQDMIAHLAKNPNICVLPESSLFEQTNVGKFDLVTMSHVFEHINNPIDYLYKLHKILAPNGHVFIEVPNEIEPVVRHHIKIKKKGIGHLFNYTEESFQLMIAKSRLFDIVSIGNYGVGVFDWMKGAKLNNFHENRNGDGVWIRCLLKRRNAENTSNVYSYLDAVLQGRYAHQYLIEAEVEQLRRESSQKHQIIRDLLTVLDPVLPEADPVLIEQSTED